MHRTQIYLDEDDYQMLKSLARRKGATLAAVIRDILKAGLNPSSAKENPDPFTHVIGIGKGDGSAVAENYEDYLYGEKS